MKSFAVLIFEINCSENEPLVKIQWSKSKVSEFGRREKGIGHASVWLHIASEERWKQSIPSKLQASCSKLCGPIAWQDAENFISEMKLNFDKLGVEHYELTCSDD